MIGQTVIIRGSRTAAHKLVDAAPQGAIMNIRPATRTGEQNNLMWALLSDVSRAKPEGRELTPEVWKALFLHSLGHQQRFEMALDGNGVIPIGFRSSRLTKEQFSDLIEVIREYGARHGVRFMDMEG
jgi:hypothetical protein